MTFDEYQDYAAERKSRVWEYMKQTPPLAIREIAAREGFTERYVRHQIKKLEQESGVIFGGWGLKYKAALSASSYRVRAQLAEQLYVLRERIGHPAKVATLVGLNPREQLRATNRPFAHDWTLSQIERLAQVLGCGLPGLGLS